MKICYLFDVDLIERSKYPRFPKLPNHALLKLTSYFKNKGYEIRLVYLPKQIPKFHNDENIYIASALYSGNLERFKKRIRLSQKSENHLGLEHIHIGTPLDSCELTDIAGLKCDYSEYDKMIEKDNILLEMYPSNVGYLTRGCIRHCKFCVNRDRNKITRVNDIDEIYVNKGKPIYLLDDNIIASDDAIELFNQITEFGKNNKDIKIYLQNGLDCRVLKEDRVIALAEASKYIERIYTAWDEVKNTYIYKNLCELKYRLSTRLYCYCLIGDHVYTKEDVKKDLLGYFYRHFSLLKINIRPVIQLYEDDCEIYKNQYILYYQVIERQYNFLRSGNYQTIYRKLPPNYKKVADELVNLLGDFSYLITSEIGEILNDDNFDDKMKEIAEYINIKHHSPPKKLMDSLKKRKYKKLN